MNRIRVRATLLLFIIGCLCSLQLFSEEIELAPDFAIPDIYTEQNVSLKDYRGIVVLVDFWASWCGPCIASFPEYNDLRNRLQEEFGKNVFEVLAINVDLTTEEAKAFLAENPVDFPILRETTGKSQRAYNLIGLPTSFLVDTEGNIQVAHQGFSPGYIELLEKKIRRLIHDSKDP